MKAPIRWHIHLFFTKVRDYGIPVITPVADFIRDMVWVHEDHKW